MDNVVYLVVSFRIDDEYGFFERYDVRKVFKNKEEAEKYQEQVKRDMDENNFLGIYECGVEVIQMVVE